MAGPEESPVTEPRVAVLLVTYALDLPDVFQMFTHHDMKELGLTLEQERAATLSNLKNCRLQSAPRPRGLRTRERFCELTSEGRKSFCHCEEPKATRQSTHHR
jgi:hypothetical protein